MIECPNHGGSFDCTPFCNLCQGEQEIDDFLNGDACADCGRTDHILATFDSEDIGRCADCHSMARQGRYDSDDESWDAWVLGVED